MAGLLGGENHPAVHKNVEGAGRTPFDFGVDPGRLLQLLS